LGDGWGGVGGGRIGYHGGSPFSTLLTMFIVFFRYIRMLFWPSGLSALYDPPIHRTVNMEVLGSASFVAILIALSILLLRRNRQLGFWPIYSALAFLPVSQIIPLITLMNDRYFYFPLVGVAALWGAGSEALRKRYGRPALVLPLVLLVIIAVASNKRAAVWKNDVTLWQNAVQQVPNKVDAWEKLAEAYHSSPVPMKEEALKAYIRALEIKPNIYSFYNLASLYFEMDDYDNAYTIVNMLLSMSPDHVMGLSLLGDIHLHRNEYIEAKNAYLRAYSLQPEAQPLLMSLGELAVIMERYDKALYYYGKVEAMGENNPFVAFQLARTELLTGDKEEAFIWLERALQRGFSDYQMLIHSEQFAVLRQDSHFERLKLKYFQGKH
jgi:Tfp pilus assembly protein PilF